MWQKNSEAYQAMDAKITTISPEDGFHYFFGYYDLNAYHKNGRYHLAHRVRFMDRLPVAEDVCELGYLDVETREFTKFAETTAWNFQQGALMTYCGQNYDRVFYNVRQGDHEYATCSHDLKTGERSYTDRACGCISPDGKWGLAVNFARIYNFRPGYGYAGRRDPFYNVNTPEEDGIFLVNMQTGKSRLLVSYERIRREFPNESYPDAKFVVNHITFNTTSDRFLFLYRNFPSRSAKGWTTSLITCDLQGNMYERLHNTFVSHYHWKNENQIMLYGEMAGIYGVHLLDDLSDRYITYPSPYFTFDAQSQPGIWNDIHCLYSPDRKYFIGDSYPKQEPCRSIYLYNTDENSCRMIHKEATVIPPVNDIRCDLHNRWNVTGDKISFDSTRSGKREICEMDLSGLL